MNQQFLKEIEMGSKNALVKKRIITHYIYNGSSTIPDLSKELDLSVPTVTKFIGEMCEDGYINDYGKLETSGGRHPNLYGLNPESGYFIGVDIKRFAVNIGLINFKGDMVELKMNIPYKFENSIEGMNELCKLILNFIKKLPINKEKILNINVNVSGRVNPESGYSFSQFNFEERPLADVLSEKLGHKVTIDNDTRAMTYGEYMQGCVKGEKDIIFVNVSWGVGIGIIIDGKLYNGGNTGAGEVGCIPYLEYDYESYCSSSYFTRVHGISGKDAFEKAKANEDVDSIILWNQFGHHVGDLMKVILFAYDPRVIILGGSIANAYEYFAPAMMDSLDSFPYPETVKNLKIYTSKVDDVAILGASTLS